MRNRKSVCVDIGEKRNAAVSAAKGDKSKDGKGKSKGAQRSQNT